MALADELAARELADGPALALPQRRTARLAPFVAHVVATYDPEVFVFAGPIAWDTEAVQLREPLRAAGGTVLRPLQRT